METDDVVMIETCAVGTTLGNHAVRAARKYQMYIVNVVSGRYIHNGYNIKRSFKYS